MISNATAENQKVQKRSEREGKIEGIGVERNGGLRRRWEAEEDLVLFLHSHYTTRVTASEKSKETQSKRW